MHQSLLDRCLKIVLLRAVVTESLWSVCYRMMLIAQQLLRARRVLCNKLTVTLWNIWSTAWMLSAEALHVLICTVRCSAIMWWFFCITRRSVQAASINGDRLCLWEPLIFNHLPLHKFDLPWLIAKNFHRSLRRWQLPRNQIWCNLLTGAYGQMREI